MLKVGILISGRGSNMEALIKASYDPNYPISFEVVISNRPNAKGIEIAQQLGINTAIIDHKKFKSRAEFDNKLTHELEKHDIDIICNAGFMRILTDDFVNKWHNKLINIHPSLLPLYKGLNTYKRAINDGVRLSGCTVHYVRADVDSGPIIAQAAVPVYKGDDEETLSARILKQEHQIYPQTLQAIAKGQISVNNDIVEINTKKQPSKAIKVC